jgi:hypothetical protein
MRCKPAIGVAHVKQMPSQSSMIANTVLLPSKTCALHLYCLIAPFLRRRREDITVAITAKDRSNAFWQRCVMGSLYWCEWLTPAERRQYGSS